MAWARQKVMTNLLIDLCVTLSACGLPSNQEISISSCSCCGTVGVDYLCTVPLLHSSSFVC